MDNVKLKKIKKWVYGNRYLIVGTGIGLLMLKTGKRANRKQTKVMGAYSDYFRISDAGKLGESMIERGCKPDERISGVVTNRSYIDFVDKIVYR